MSRVVYVGGFGNGRGSAERVATALERYYENVDEFTFSEAVADPSKVRRAVRGVDVVTHSAGMLPLVGTAPNTIDAFSPPLPSAKLRLIGRTGLKTVRMHTPGIGIRSIRDIASVASYDVSSVAEFTAHPGRNFGQLTAITTFDAVDAAIAAKESGIHTYLNYSNGDEYYQLPEQREAAARAMGVGVLRMPGIHDELVIRPDATLAYRVD